MNPTVIMLKASEAAADAFDCTAADLLRRKRGPLNVAHARFVAWWIIRQHSSISVARIGMFFGNRCHTTILNGLNSVNDWVENPDIFLAKSELAATALKTFAEAIKR